ncbi:hypothetical protein V6N11_020767 [Hibiscus sabdariffa]|uniref:Uncharacterized protein n=1 Tax=Hibiscus sabdariffa TaxID=183260 RepID=A0ABR2Q9E6_9ROSI
MRIQGDKLHPKERSNISEELDMDKKTIGNKMRLSMRRTFQGNMATTKEEASENDEEELKEDMKALTPIATTKSNIHYNNEEDLEEDLEKSTHAITIELRIDMFKKIDSHLVELDEGSLSFMRKCWEL